MASAPNAGSKSLNEPIIIACTGRCGSSLTCNIFTAHGVWTGECLGADWRNKKGYFENLKIKRAVQKREPREMASSIPFDPKWRGEVERMIADDGYRGGPWLVKINAISIPLWGGFDPKWVIPRRAPEKIFASVRKAGFVTRLDDRQLEHAIAFQIAALDRLRDEHGAVEVWPDELVRGDFSSAERALKYAGLEPKADIIRAVVDPTLWAA